jgi:hypothetical protein
MNMDLMIKKIMEVEIKLKLNLIQHKDFEIIIAVTRSIKFKCDVFQLLLTAQNSLSLRIIKRIILWKTDFKNTWMKFPISNT